MAIQSQPSRISQPFAGSGTKNTIPATNVAPSASQAASWASGFPPECSQPISAGGCPVPRNDMNGVLNQLSQDFAFRQDGGVWAWSASADYDTGRIVRGSDGLLYQSVAQSGPGLVAGAQDPTADNGTYWQSPKLLTMPLGDKSSAGATTEWVKDLAVAPIYVDPAGSDSNDGLSAAAAVQTLQRALDLAASKPTAETRLAYVSVAAGVYSGNVSLISGRYVLALQGDVSVSGNLSVESGGKLAFIGNHQVTLAGDVLLDSGSSFLSYGPIVQTGKIDVRVNSFYYVSGSLSLTTSGSTAMEISSGSVLVVSNAVSVSVSNTSYGIKVLRDASFISLGAFSISASTLSTGAVYVADKSVFHVGSFSMSGSSCPQATILSELSEFSSAGGFSVDSNILTGAAIQSTSNSLAVVGGSISIYSSGVAVSASFGGRIHFIPGAQASITAGTVAISLLNGGFFEHESGKLTIVGLPGVSQALRLSGGSVVVLAADLEISTGSFSYAVVSCDMNSSFWFSSTATVTYGATGLCCIVLSGSQVSVGGTGLRRFPGSADAYAEPTEYALYK